jgi:hypothetical protein
MQVQQDLRDPAHANPANPDEVNPLRLSEHWPS